MSTVLISSIDRSTTYPIYQSVSIPNNQMFLTINTSTWTEQMFYELPNIQFGIYTKVNGEYVKYLSENITVKTKVPESSTSPADAICYKIINIPNEFYLYIKPIFDNNAIEAHNALIENGIEDGTIWTTPTDTFNIEIGYNLGDYVPVTQTITAVPPISFKSDGTPLTSVTIKGNGQQNGTPSPQNIVPFDGTGERTGNLFDCDRTEGIIDNSYIRKSDGATVADTYYYISYPIYVSEDATYTWRFHDSANTVHSAPTVGFYDASDNMIGAASHRDNVKYFSFTTPNGCKYIRASVYKRSNLQREAMLNLGFTALPYEPYGWKIPITCAGQTVPVYLGQTQTVRRVKKLVLDGTEEWILSTGWKKTATSVFYRSLADIIHVSADSAVFIYSNAFAAATRNELYNGDSDMVARTGTEALTIRVSDSIATTVPDFKAFLAAQKTAGHPVVVWYVLASPTEGVTNEPLYKIGTYCDELTTTTPIPTAKGSNTLTVDTTVQPSEVSITGNITQI